MRLRDNVMLAVSGLIVLWGTAALSDAGHEGNPALGEKVFKKCKACHSLEDGKNKIGPTLYGIFGREAGAVDGYKYSAALKESGVVWSEETIDQYIEKPKAFIKGTKMAFPGLKKEDDRKNLVAYLKGATE